MGLIDIIRHALDKIEVTKLKKRLARLDVEVTKQGKMFKSLKTTLDTRSSLWSFEYILSDGTTYKQSNPPKKTKCKKTKKPTKRITPVDKCPTDDPPRCKRPLFHTLVGRSYDYNENSAWAEDYEPGVKVLLVVRRDGTKDIEKFVWSDKLSMPKRTTWWIESEEKVCKRFNVTVTRPFEEPLISLGLINLRTP